MKEFSQFCVVPVKQHLHKHRNRQENVIRGECAVSYSLEPLLAAGTFISPSLNCELCEWTPADCQLIPQRQ